MRNNGWTVSDWLRNRQDQLLFESLKEQAQPATVLNCLTAKGKELEDAYNLLHRLRKSPPSDRRDDLLLKVSDWLGLQGDLSGQPLFSAYALEKHTSEACTALFELNSAIKSSMASKINCYEEEIKRLNGVVESMSADLRNANSQVASILVSQESTVPVGKSTPGWRRHTVFMLLLTLLYAFAASLWF
jgi:hypothetical protein